MMTIPYPRGTVGRIFKGDHYTLIRFYDLKNRFLKSFNLSNVAAELFPACYDPILANILLQDLKNIRICKLIQSITVNV